MIECVYEVIDYSDGEGRYRVGIYPTFEAAIAGLDGDDEPPNYYHRQGRLVLRIYEREFGPTGLGVPLWAREWKQEKAFDPWVPVYATFFNNPKTGTTYERLSSHS